MPKDNILSYFYALSISTTLLLNLYIGYVSTPRHRNISCLLTESRVSPVVYRVFFKVCRALARMYGDAEPEVAELMEVGCLDFYGLVPVADGDDFVVDVYYLECLRVEDIHFFVGCMHDDGPNLQAGSVKKR